MKQTPLIFAIFASLLGCTPKNIEMTPGVGSTSCKIGMSRSQIDEKTKKELKNNLFFDRNDNLCFISSISDPKYTIVGYDVKIGTVINESLIGKLKEISGDNDKINQGPLKHMSAGDGVIFCLDDKNILKEFDIVPLNAKDKRIEIISR